MTNNCLVTKLKDAVDNKSIPYFGWVTCRVTSYSESTSNDKVFSMIPLRASSPSYMIKEGECYRDLAHTSAIPINTVINSTTAYTMTIIHMDKSATATILVKPNNIWWTFRIGAVNAGAVVGNDIGSNTAVWMSVDMDALAASICSIVFLEYVSVECNTTIENFFIKKFRYLKKLGNRLFNNLTSGYVPCIRNTRQNLLQSQKNITWRGEPFYNKHLYFNFDYDNDKVNIFDTAEVVDEANYSVSHKIAEYNDTTKEWTFFD